MKERFLYIEEIDGQKDFQNKKLQISDSGFLSSTGSRAIFVTFKYDKNDKGKKKLIGKESVTDIIDRVSNYAVYKNKRKHLLNKREVIAITTIIDDNGRIGETYKIVYEEHNLYEVNRYNIVIPFFDFLGGDINLGEREELGVCQKKNVQDNVKTKIDLLSCYKDYQEAVKYVAEASKQNAKSMAQALKDKVQAPVTNIGEVATVLGAAVLFLSKYTKNPYVLTAGAATTYTGVITLAATWAIAGVEEEDLVFELPQKDGMSHLGIYRNHITNKLSLDKTPEWGIKE